MSTEVACGIDEGILVILCGFCERVEEYKILVLEMRVLIVRKRKDKYGMGKVRKNRVLVILVVSV